MLDVAFTVATMITSVLVDLRASNLNDCPRNTKGKGPQHHNHAEDGLQGQKQSSKETRQDLKLHQEAFIIIRIHCF